MMLKVLQQSTMVYHQNEHGFFSPIDTLGGDQHSFHTSKVTAPSLIRDSKPPKADERTGEPEGPDTRN